MLPAAQESMPIVGRAEGVTGERPSNTAVVAEGTAKELCLALPSGGSHPLVWDEPLL